MSKDGLVYFTYSEDHGTRKKGDKVEMHSTTAAALEAHKIGKPGAKVVVEKIEDLRSPEAKEQVKKNKK